MSQASRRLDASIKAMADRYPALTLIRDGSDASCMAVWEGWLQPIGSLRNFDLIIYDLHYNRPIMIGEDGEILHNPRCKGPHDKPSIRKYLKRPNRSFKVRIEHAGGSRHPRAFMLDPILVRRPGDHTFGDGASCAYPAWEDVWEWQRDTVADFTDHVLVWLVKWNLFDETNGKLWLGPEMNHDAFFLAATINSNSQCWCGSGKCYVSCHRAEDMVRAEDELCAMLRARSSLIQNSRIDKRNIKTLLRFI
ncbi:MAG: hypothetical protein IPM50_03220 [Acidobacteriota bacterium]|nr:MAG: hypothetical protein IPM50_03220 [Acidobacteriota bacterium]